jgi:hypothetical protein
MKCHLCKENKLSKEFPFYALTEKCDHPLLHCLDVSIQLACLFCLYNLYYMLHASNYLCEVPVFHTMKYKGKAVYIGELEVASQTVCLIKS